MMSSQELLLLQLCAGLGFEPPPAVGRGLTQKLSTACLNFVRRRVVFVLFRSLDMYSLMMADHQVETGGLFM
jgi:hypothetical protein